MPTNVLDPQIWNAMPAETRASSNQVIQEEMIKSILGVTGLGDRLLETRKQRPINRLAVLIARRDDPLAKPHLDKMTDEQIYWVDVFKVDEAPTGGNDKFVQLLSVAKNNTPEGDVWCFICGEGLAFLSSINLDEWKKKYEEEKAPAVSNAEQIPASI